MPDINMSVFEEAQRNQLVTEVDIQTQVALDNYQVHLSDIANPTQSQNNVVVDRFGEFLPHWNESLDFDTWVKMSMELAGKKLLMVHGNDSLSSESNGDDTFIQWHGATTTTFLESLIALPSSYIVENRIKPTSEPNNMHTGVANTELVTDDRVTIQTVQSNNLRYISTGNEGTTTYKQESPCLTNNVYVHGKIIFDGVGFEGYIDGNQISTGQITTNLPNENMGLVFKIYQGTFSQDWSFIRKYIAAEPTYSISTPKNISTALKSLGRAG